MLSCLVELKLAITISNLHVLEKSIFSYETKSKQNKEHWEKIIQNKNKNKNKEIQIGKKMQVKMFLKSQAKSQNDDSKSNIQSRFFKNISSNVDEPF